MATELSDTIRGRLVKLLRRMRGGSPFDPDVNPRLDQLLSNLTIRRSLPRRLNNQAEGFADFLEDEIPASKIKGTLKLSALLKLVLDAGNVKTIDAYVAARRERVRLELRCQIVNVSGGRIEKRFIEPSDQVERYLPDPDDDIEELRDALNRELNKYLLTSVRTGDLRRSVVRAADRIVDGRMRV